MPRSTEAQARRRIESAALKLFANKPFSAVRLDEIAAEANASLQTIYRYYGDKSGLLEVCMDDWLGQLARRMLDHLQGIESYKERLRKVFWVVIDFFERNPQVISMMANAVTPAIWQQNATFRQRALTRELLQMFSQGRAQGILTDEVSEALLLDYFYGVLFRIVPMNLARGRPESLSAQANTLFEMLWRAIARPVRDDRQSARAGPAARPAGR
jgi:AcrR family transcriptional regulator